MSASAMPTGTVLQRKKAIFELLRDSSNVETIFLVGASGVGKTWTAKQVSNFAIKEGLFEIALWVPVSTKFDENSVCKIIDRQLSLLPIAEKWEAEDGNKRAEEESNEVLLGRIVAFLRRKKFLLILDGLTDEMDGKEVISKLMWLLNPLEKSSHKVMVTSVRSISSDASTGNERVIQVEPLSVKESLALLQEKVGREVYEVPSIKVLGEEFIKKTKYLPAAIISMAKAISYFSQRDFGSWMLKSALEEASDVESYNMKQLLRCGYDVLPRSVLIDCCRRGRHLFHDSGSIHYTELIAYWMLEGYLGHVDCIEKAYEKGHSVFMELMDCQVLKKLEGGYVIMGKDIIHLDDYDRHGFGGTASLGLADLSAAPEWEGFGRITRAEGMIKSLFTGKKEEKLSTVFLNGTNCAEILDMSPESKQELQVLALFNLTLKSLAQLLSDMHKLFILVIRGCDFLERMDHQFEFEKLTVLEISNASSLKTIPDEFFDHMPQLQSLHISELKVDPLPSSLEKLRELRWLILRECSCFTTLCSLKNFKDLMVLDVSGATSLIKFKDKTFKDTPKIQTINVSRTNIKKLPKFVNLPELTHLSLSDCYSLVRLPKTDSLSTLQTLDLSGARHFEEFHEQSMGNRGTLKILDLSKTPLKTLPSNINSRQLFLRCCPNLQELPCIESLEDVEVLDLSGTKSLVKIEDEFFNLRKSLQVVNLSGTSIKTLPPLSNVCNLQKLLLPGCTTLEEIGDKSFEHMSLLQHLDLSETRIKSLPSLSNPSSLTVLSLKNCTNLTELPPLENLYNLEELNLRGISSLSVTKAGFLECMSHLRTLDLSETQLNWLPPMSNLKSLSQLFLGGCESLEEVPNLEELTRLEVLDISGTAVSDLTCLANCSNLRQLSLMGCSKLDKFRFLDPLETIVEELPYGISTLTNLKCLDIPHTKSLQGAESRKTQPLPDAVDPCHWGIFGFRDEALGFNDKPLISVSGIQVLQSLKENPSLLEGSISRFHYCVHPAKGQNKNGDTYSYRNDLIFRDLHFQTAEFDRFKEQRSLEIHGFDVFPKGVEVVLCNADCVFLINNTFNKWLSDVGVSNLKAMKACWIERCTEMEGVFHARKEDDVTKLGMAVEFLGISNAINLNCIHSGNLPCRGFQNLKSLYLDCCPKLSTVFSASQLPQNLKVLQVKFCDKLENLFSQSSSDTVLQNLETLYLWELPELKSIGCSFPSLQTLKAWECPKLQKLEESIRLMASLQTLWISNVVDLRSIYSGSQQSESLRNLETLVLESCPMLGTVISSPHRPQSLKTLKIKSCNNLKTLFGHSTLSDYILSNLQTLHLQKLPELEKIGGNLPSVVKPIIMGCPNCRYPEVA
ncbi:hypothetical protein Acr_08g0001790 [Actinidia rufa]|uniref:NB-ARC domain-containing disease resistance protein n=1 Tax=Actinidia rufa TaxID=165716 RepID=A0A7J0EZI3_9ERIC|nr:hypothetical protein Acr_08g0001790 [Actinidia rufa]